jgi:hypothetical protein
VVLAAMLRARGFPVTTTRDAGHLGQVDEHQLRTAADAVMAEPGAAEPTPQMKREAKRGGHRAYEGRRTGRFSVLYLAMWPRDRHVSLES